MEGFRREIFTLSEEKDLFNLGLFGRILEILIGKARLEGEFLKLRALRSYLKPGPIWISIEYSAEEAMAPHSSTLAWKIPWTEEPGRLQSMGSLRVGHD